MTTAPARLQHKITELIEEYGIPYYRAASITGTKVEIIQDIVNGGTDMGGPLLMNIWTKLNQHLDSDSNKAS